MTRTKNAVFYSATAALILMSQASLAHTRIQSPQIDEKARVYNNVVIGHGCHDPQTGASSIDTFGTVVVFPDGADSIITVNGAPSDKMLSDFISGWGIRKVQSKDVFGMEGRILDANGNTVGFWAGGAPGLTAGSIGLIPFRTNATTINEDSCAKSIKMNVSIVDICSITDIQGFDDSNVQRWTSLVGSNYDRADNTSSPATLTINRTSALPAECGAGDTVEVTPSANQLNRDMPIKINGAQVWPAPHAN